LIPEEIFFSMFVGLEADQIKEIQKAVEQREKDLIDEEEDEEPPVSPEEDDEEDEEEQE
jgi:hypothetical protein